MRYFSGSTADGAKVEKTAEDGENVNIVVVVEVIVVVDVTVVVEVNVVVEVAVVVIEDK